MDIRSFLQLDREAQFRWIENLVMGQNPRLRIGERMSGPVGVFKNGRTYTSPVTLHLEDLHASPATTMVRQHVLDSALLDGHPWLDIDVGTNNWLHLYEVNIEHPFTGFSAGDQLPVSYGRARFTVPLTEDMIVEHTQIVIRVGFSK